MMDDQALLRYSRQIMLPEVDIGGQERLSAAHALIIGAGGLGSPLLLYLAAAGVGTLGIIDDDEVDLTNLQRQIAHGTASVGSSKVASAAESVARINPGIRVNRYEERLTAENAATLFADYDLIADGSDNFTTRYLVNDAAYLSGKPLVSGSLLRFEGQLATFRGGVPGHEGEPCYRCLFPTEPPPGMIPRCEEAGILGAVAGVIGTLQATEVLKELLDLGSSLSGHLLIYDALGPTFRKMKAARDPGCALCGTDPTIREIA